MASAPSIVFMGTPEFAVPALRALHERYGVTAVVTIPDKPKGRGLALHASDVKLCAQELGIGHILQPSSLRDDAFREELAALKPDIFCVIAFRILPRQVYALPRLGAFNVHASLLPRHRGAAPINHAIIAGDTESGVTSFLLNDVVDTGNVLLQRRIPVGNDMTAGDLYAALMPLAAQCAVDTCAMLLDGTAAPSMQDSALATPAPKVFRETSGIDWNQPRERVRNTIRGLSPAPCAWTPWNGDVLKIYASRYSDATIPTGTWKIQDGSILAGCADGTLALTTVQLPGKKRMDAEDVIRGYRGDMSGTFQ